MTRNFFKTTLIALSLVSMTSLGFVAPAAAAGSFSLSFATNSPRHAQELRAGMQIFNILNSLENRGGVIHQNGRNNAAGLRQNGNGNFGTVWQEGEGHHGQLEQNGSGNAYGVYQFGRNTDVNVRQIGNGQTGATFVFGF